MECNFYDEKEKTCKLKTTFDDSCDGRCCILMQIAEKVFEDEVQ